MATEHPAPTPTKDKSFEVTVDGETVTTDRHELTAGDVLALAGKDPAGYYLVELKGPRERKEYKDPAESVHLHPGSTFVTVSTGPTPVS
jgi:hypothetical protein